MAYLTPREDKPTNYAYIYYNKDYHLDSPRIESDDIVRVIGNMDSDDEMYLQHDREYDRK